MTWVRHASICAQAAPGSWPPQPGACTARRAVVGFDGFVDSIIAVVDKRYGPERFDPVATIADFGDKIRHAAGESSNYELVVRRRKLGGNGPIMAHALACLGLDVTYIGNLGYPTLDPVFEEFARRAKVISIGDPGLTDALEFDDGKIMLGKYESLDQVNWDNLVSRVGREPFEELVRGAALIGLVNWTMLTQMSRVWERLIDEVLPAAPRHEGTMFIDLADPEKRTPEDIREALGLLTRFQERVDVVFGMNLKEATEIIDVLGLPSRKDPEGDIADEASEIREALGIACVVVHPRRSAAAATATECAWFPGPFIQHPQISTGAGDHFNAGFCLGRMTGLGLEECLCAGVGTSGYYVRTGQSPSATELAEFVRELPPPQA